MRYVVWIGGVVGIVGVFLPLVSGNGHTVTFWSLRDAQYVQTLLLMAAYALGTVMGVVMMLRPPRNWQAQLAFAGYAFALIKFARSFWDILGTLAIGGDVMLAGALVGLVATIVVMLRPTTS